MEEFEFEFDGQRPDEKVILSKKKHPWVLFRGGIFTVVLIAVIGLAFLIWGASLFSVVILIAGLVIIIAFNVVRWFIYTNGIYILTNQRIIDINQKGLFNRVVSETELDNIYNTSYEVKGVAPSLLNFGNVLVSTVGDDISTITLEDVENPHFVQDQIVHARKNLIDAGANINANTKNSNKPIIR